MKSENIVLKYIKNLKGKWTLLLLCILGVGLLILSRTGNADTKVSGEDQYFEYCAAYKSELEGELTELCRQIEGVGDVSVTVSLDSGIEYVYATNGSSGKESYVTYSGKGILLKYNMPSVRGVAVVCTGADSDDVRSEVTEAISSLLGIKYTKISVSKKA